MSITAFTGPLVAFADSAPSANTNPDQGPSPIVSGVALLDPRAPFTYQPGQDDSEPAYCFLATEAQCVNAVPSALSATNIAAAQVPTANTALTLVSASGSGITVGVSIKNAATGTTVSGLLAIDGAMGGVAFGQTGAVTAWDPTKAIARNLRFTSVGNDSTGTATVVGYDLYGYPMSETITLANAGVASGKKAFKYIVSVTPGGTLSGANLSVGTGDVYGFPLRVDQFAFARIAWGSAVITASTGFTAAVTTSPATSTTGDVRGTYAVQSASDGSKSLQIFITPAVANVNSVTGLFGVTQA